MLLNASKKLCQKGASFAIKALPVIVPAFLLFHKLNLLYCKRSADAAEQHKKVQKVLSYDT